MLPAPHVDGWLTNLMLMGDESLDRAGKTCVNIFRCIRISSLPASHTPRWAGHKGGLPWIPLQEVPPQRIRPKES